MSKLSTHESGHPFNGALVIRECSVRRSSNSNDHLTLCLTDSETNIILVRVWADRSH